MNRTTKEEGGTSQRWFKPYPAYKDSGVACLGKIPVDWKVRRMRFVSHLNPAKSEVRSLDPELPVSFVPMESVGEYGGLVLDTTKPLGQCLEGYTYFRDGDVVVAKITPCFENGKGALAAALENGIAFGTTELQVLRSKSSLDAGFLFYVTLSDHFRRLGAAAMYGAGGQKRVPEDFVRDLPHPLPSKLEQRSIAAFLDRETVRIDALVAKKERLIALLQEKRTALITKAVTKGLDPNVLMKDSGVEWLGEIPTHWTGKPLRWAIMFQRGHDLPTDEREDGLVPIVSSSGISSTHCLAIAKAPGIVTGRYGTIGHFHLITQDYWPLNTTLYSIDLYRNDPRFLRYMLTHLSPLFLLNAVKSAVPRVDRNDIHPIRTAVPPVSEQREIADFLDAQSAEIDALVAKIRDAIDRLRELRTALISAAVTGKIDVREKTAR